MCFTSLVGTSQSNQVDKIDRHAHTHTHTHKHTHTHTRARARNTHTHRVQEVCVYRYCKGGKSSFPHTLIETWLSALLTQHRLTKENHTNLLNMLYDTGAFGSQDTKETRKPVYFLCYL
jgi:hypothetical protein